jgi:hypothetical protein
MSLSNQVTNYNFKLAIYEELHKKTLEELLLRFTPEIRKQYEDSILWKSFVESLASELAQSRFEIKEALKQLNLQKAIDVFLNMWNGIVGISRENVTDAVTGELRPETDAEYRQRLVDSVFWDKISNLALKKTMLLKLGRDATVTDSGTPADTFKVLPEQAIAKLTADWDLRYFTDEIITFGFVGPSFTAKCVSDDGSTLVYSDYVGPDTQPAWIQGNNTNLFRAIPTGPPAAGKVELISLGAFDTAESMAQVSHDQHNQAFWRIYDAGNEGPPDPTPRTFRPTTYTVSGIYSVTNPTYAYDTNVNSYAEVLGGSWQSGSPSIFTVSGFTGPAGGATSVNLIVKVRGPSSAWFASYKYSKNNGVNWTTISVPIIIGGGINDAGLAEGTVTIALPLDQDLSQVRVQVMNEGTYTDEFGSSYTPTYVYDVRIEGYGWPAPGVSLWTAEYGGAMKLQYGVAAREYKIPTVVGEAFDITFDVLAGSVYVTLGTTSGGTQLGGPTLYNVGTGHTISIIAGSAPNDCYLRFYQAGTTIGYVDNVSCLQDGPITSGTLKHDPLYNTLGFWVNTPGTLLTFVSQDGLTTNYGNFLSNIGGVLTFERNIASGIPSQYDYIKADIAGVSYHLAVLASDPELVTSSNVSIHPKLLSNIYSVNLGVVSLPDSALNEIFDTIFPLAALGNVLIKIVQDVIASFDDWDVIYGNIPYGPIFMGAPTYTGSKTTAGDDWAIDEELYLDNQWTMGDGKKFYGNDGPDDIVTLTRTS